MTQDRDDTGQRGHMTKRTQDKEDTGQRGHRGHREDTGQSGHIEDT